MSTSINKLKPKYVNVKSLIALFSQIISIICLLISVSSSSMDRYTHKSRKNDKFSNTNQVICIFGPIGCGKTTWAHANLDFIEVTESILKSKDTTLEFISRIKTLNRHVLVDNFDGMIDYQGAPYFTQPVTRACTILVSTHYIEGTVPYEMKGPDLRQSKFKTQGWGDTDDFMEPSEIIKRHLVSKQDNTKLLDTIHCEHGNVLGLIHENYTSAKPSLETMSRVTMALSDAAVIDDHMYDGVWDLMPYFVTVGCSIPCHLLDGSVKTMSPATIWTKYMNMCTRRKLFKASGLDLDTADFMSRTGTVLKFYNLNNKNGRRGARKASHRPSS
jgi:hypothetical protein